MGRIFLGNAMEFWRNLIILLTGGVSLLFEWIRDGFGGCSRGDCGWKLCSELGSVSEVLFSQKFDQKLPSGLDAVFTRKIFTKLLTKV